jgi:intermembrane space import and assembly protein 40
MQDCFREYPEVYGSELETEDEEDNVAADLAQPETGASGKAASSQQDKLAPLESADSAARDGFSQKKDHSLVPESYRPIVDDMDSETNSAQVRREHDPVQENAGTVPKAAINAMEADAQKKQ